MRKTAKTMSLRGTDRSVSGAQAGRPLHPLLENVIPPSPLSGYAICAH